MARAKNNRPRLKAVAPDQYKRMNREVLHNLEVWIVQRRKTSAEVMRAAGLSRSTISQWRKGFLPSLSSLYALARALGCSIYDLVPEK